MIPSSSRRTGRPTSSKTAEAGRAHLRTGGKNVQPHFCDPGNGAVPKPELSGSALRTGAHFTAYRLLPRAGCPGDLPFGGGFFVPGMRRNHYLFLSLDVINSHCIAYEIDHPCLRCFLPVRLLPAGAGVYGPWTAGRIVHEDRPAGRLRSGDRPVPDGQFLPFSLCRLKRRCRDSNSSGSH